MSGASLVAEVHNFEHVPHLAGRLRCLAGLSVRHGFIITALSMLSCRTRARPNSPV